MKLHFEPDLDFQLKAIEAVCNLFRGQEVCRTEFTVTSDSTQSQAVLAFPENELGIGNELTIPDAKVLANLNAIQIQNSVLPSGHLISGDFTVEMETGTGKTYVYLRTIFELNKRYGFTKFVIVVPSIAIKEGVYKSLQITNDHFRMLYSGTPAAYFLYDSTKLGQVRNFATSSQIQIMVVTVGAVNKRDVNNLYKDSEKTGGEKPIDLIKATRPILIVDEPQSVDGGLAGHGKKALEAMNPLCTLRYSATHAHKHHMVYQLDAVDAYERKLVKQIEVASATVEDAHNKPYVRLMSTSSRRGAISAKVEIDIEVAGKVQRKVKIVQDGDDLNQVTGRAVYADCRIGEIRVGKNKFINLRVSGDECYLRPGEAYGDVDPTLVQRQMIRRTIKEHLDKETRLVPQGVKVLSLFFIDAVDRYRQYDTDGNAIKGDYARMFEEEYQSLAKHPDYSELFRGKDVSADSEEAHNGYFSIDKKGTWTNTSESNQPNRENAERAYSLIMREKEKLLSLNTPLKFIFSHSALREGWDSPNVFQICALRNVGTERERRQTIGRGLRLCVNQDGERQHGFDVNTLTVIAMDSYENFAENLQREFEKDTGIRFGVIEEYQFANILVDGKSDQSMTPGLEASKRLWNYLKERGYIDKDGRVQDLLKRELKNGCFSVPDEYVDQQENIVHLLRRLAGRLEVKNADERCSVRPRQAVLESQEFKALWDRIKHKTTYRVAFNNDSLREQCTRGLSKAPMIPRSRLQWSRANIAIGQSGVEATETTGASPVALGETDIELPDVLTELQERTQLTRRSIQKILCGSGRLDDFKRNPQKFIEIAEQVIKHCKRQALVDGIKYQRLGDQHFYSQELFEEKELTSYLKNTLSAKKSVHEQVIYEYGIEKQFAKDLEKDTDVKVYAKLPGWFTVPTPLGGYNPDWAVLIDSGEGERLYFVVETKGSSFLHDLRSKERAKIMCGKAHFNALSLDGSPIRYEVTEDFNKLDREPR